MRKPRRQAGAPIITLPAEKGRLSQIRCPPFCIQWVPLLPTGEARRRTGADLEAVLHRQQLLQIWVLSDVEQATVGPTPGGLDVKPLHHSEILMVDDMAMRDKAAHGDRIEIHPKRDRSRHCQIDVLAGWPSTGIAIGGRGYKGGCVRPSRSQSSSLATKLGRGRLVRAGGAGSRDKQGVVPFGQRQGDAVYLCDQHMVLMEV